MALIKAGNGSSLSGLVGSVVIVQTKSGSYMRGAPNYSNSSWTKKQRAHRERFKKVSKFVKQFKERLLPQIWNDANERLSGHALFLKTNMGAFSAEGELTAPLNLKLSTGTLDFPQGLQLSAGEAANGPLTVSWTNGAIGGVRMYDELMVISSGGGMYSDIFDTGLLRGNKGGSFELPPLEAAATHLYLFFGSRDRRSYSGSECFEISVN
ncbi:MAG TPA: hypothetical protein VFG54_05895 [Prolixibacteraceae bacterium]|nr:hypothetical protein [Prolixibacteraceae bacterium]